MPGGYAGVSNRVVTILSVDRPGMRAQAVDDQGLRIEVNLSIMRAKGMSPRRGEVWMVDRSFGDWTLAGILNRDPLLAEGFEQARAVLLAQVDPDQPDPSQTDLNAAIATVLLALSN